MAQCSACTVCDECEFPPLQRCLACGGAVELRPLPVTGRVFSGTTVRAAGLAGGHYTVAYVDLDDGPRVFGTVRIAGADPIPEEVAVIAVAPLTFAARS